ncbi:MAG: carboxypeptidase regulatory-like domain-containing protein [Cytophagaceae bacterium]|nr:carboxypeptidase regulatory-like domain-containing protein [Gemmatimonadaceae bacterium]
MRTLPLVVLASLALALPAGAQRFEGIVVVGATKIAAQQAQVVLLGKRDVFVDSAVTDAFGGFSVEADKPGKYTLLVRRKGYLPITTEPFELPEGELLTDTVFLAGRQAELSYKDALNESIRRVFGASAMSGMSRLIGPDSLAVLRARSNTLGDLVRTGRLLGVSLPGGSASGCLRFSGESYCGQLFIDELPVNLRPDQIYLGDVEAVMALRGQELGSAVMDTRRFDASRYGAVLIYTNRFSIR